MKTFRSACVAILLALCPMVLHGQSTNAAIEGRITDPSKAVVPHAKIEVINTATNLRYGTEADDSGSYAFLNLPPGNYRMEVEKQGFTSIVKPDVLLHVQDTVQINFEMALGSATETVTIEAGAPLLDTTDATVGTVIDRQLVGNLPLNGRSFNTLLQLTPGVVIAQQGSNFSNGQFSVAGQRTSANSFMVDGVSANFGVSASAGITGSGGGTQQAFSALGGTSSLVSVDALQEFRVETSSFAAEFGRSSGGQVILSTRSGTNDLHGGIFEYFRNDVMDANNWFANRAGQPRAAERHNDFGGFLGGAIRKDKTFVFLSYEGARLKEPDTVITQVPSEYARMIAPSQLAPFLDAYPQPDDRVPVAGVYTQTFTGNFSNPSTLDAGSARLDHVFSDRWSVFVRYNDAPSQTAVRVNALSEIDTTQVDTRTLTGGVTFVPSSRVSNSFRGNYSLQKSSLLFSLDSFGGATPPNPSTLAPSPLNSGQTYVSFDLFDASAYQSGPNAKNRNSQLTFADDVSVTEGAHQLKFGADYRAIFLGARPFQTFADYFGSSVSAFLSSGELSLYGVSTKNSEYLIQASSLYGQDTWRMNTRLSLTYGLRWELSPAPTGRDQTTLAAWRNVDDPSALSLGPNGSQLWATTYSNVAPRVGVAYKLTPSGDTVLRAGWGIFYDLATGSVGALSTAFPNDESLFTPTVGLPLSNPNQFFPILSDEPPYTGNVLGYSPELKLPRSYQWNVALEKSFGGTQSLSVTYAGQAGRNLLRQEALPQPNSNFAPGTNFLLISNDARSNYSALQVQYRRPFANGLQILANYTYSHSLDDASDDIVTGVSNTVVSAANDYASSSFDVRHSFSAAVAYSLPTTNAYGLRSLFVRNWSFDAVMVARSGFPFNATVLSGALAGANPRPDLVPGQPLWIANATAGGGKSLNPAAFSIPSGIRQGTEGRNDIPGFGLTQVDLSIARRFPLGEKAALQFRADAFNALNHPNFTNPYGYIGFGPVYLESPSMLNQGLGGLNPLFQEGGPRSLQLSLRLTF